MDDLVSKLLAAINETEQNAHGSGVVAWATYRHADGSMKYTSPVSGGGDLWFTAGEQTKPDSVRVIFDERAELRRCAADRRRLERHTPVPDHGRFSDDWADGCPHPGDCYCTERPPVCRSCRDHAGDPIAAPCPDFLDLADSYGFTPQSRAVHGIDLSGIDLGEIPEAERDRIAAKLATLPTVTFKVEGYLVPREHVDSPDCWCGPVGPALIRRDLPGDDGGDL